MVGSCASAMLAVGGATPSGAQRSETAPTFNDAVAPILFSRCVECHRPGEAAPMSLLSYDAVRPWARAIKTRVQAGEMPPWPPDSRGGEFANERRLSEREIDTLVRWVDAGAPQGNGSAPTPPAFIEGWSARMGRPPDLVIDAPVFDLPATGLIPEFKVWSPQPFGKDRFVEAIELRPTNRSVVHHASVFRASLPKGASVGTSALWPGGPALPGVPLTRNGVPLPEAQLPSFGTPLVFYVPAGGFLNLPKGVVKRITGTEYLQWTFHLVTTGKPERASARLGVWFSRAEPERELLTWTVTDQIVVNGRTVGRDARGPLFPNIPAGAADYTVLGTMRVTEPVTLYALWPHMHYRGRDITFSVQDAKGVERTLLSIPRYRFAWQFTYALARPLKIAAGSTLKVVAHYDNSALNDDNPDPREEVIWGPQGNNEMFDPFVELSLDRRPLRPACDAEPRLRDGDTGPGFLTPCP
jgi:hypothetical protein